MSDGEGPDSPTGDGPVGKRTGGPPAAGTSVFQLNSELNDKLMLLNYEKEFCVEHDLVPFPRTYFALPGGSTQFYHFLELSKWLMQNCRRDFTTDKYDDPNTSVNKIMLELKQMGFEMDFPASKLRTANGDPVCRVLNFLADQALIAHDFRWDEPVYPEEDFAEEADVDDAAEIAGEVEDAIADNAEEEVLYSELVTNERKDEFDQQVHGVLEATVDPIEWRKELERVGPRLQGPSIISGKEWRAHLEQTLQHEKVVNDILPDTQRVLEKIGTEVGTMLERVIAKEKYLNTQFERFSDEYRQEQEKLKVAQDAYQATSQQVTELTQQLASVTDSLEEIKSHMEDRGNSMTDTSPLVKIKQALAQLKTEIKTMELRIGVVGHTLMQSKIRHKTSRDAVNPKDVPEFDVDDDGADAY